MIITHLTLENYKQYRGSTTIPIAESATVGVVGANGVGKTTIFEAIEWCLYKPTSIRNDDIRPRNVGGEVRVVVQLATETGNDVFEVERILKRSATPATIYRLNELGGGDPIVQGTREVTDYITTRLIGLSHSAFVATFFTRQKELSFFGTLRPAERRREVGKLLGLETIKQAQAIIAEERSKARADADALQRRYDAQTEGRDLEKEIQGVLGTMSEHGDAVTIAQTAVATAEQQLADAEKGNQELQRLRDADAGVAADLRDQESRQLAEQERKKRLVADLAHLDEQQDERTKLVPLAGRLEALAAQLKALERERDRFQRRQHATEESERVEKDLQGRISEIRTIMDHASPGTDSPDWTWSNDDTNDPIRAIDRLTAVASAVDLSVGEQRCGAMRQALTASEQVDREQAKLKTYLKSRDELNQRVANLTAHGNPSQLRQEASSRLDELRSTVSAKHAEVDSLSAQQDRSRQLIDRLRQQHFEDTCPTCGRPFDDEEADLVIGTMREAIASREQAIASARREASSVSAKVTLLQREIDELQKRENAVLEAKTRIANSVEYIERQESEVQRWQSTLDGTLRELSVSVVPTREEIEAADQELARRRALHQTVQPLQMLRRNVDASLRRREQIGQELATLTNITWDPDAWQAVTADHDKASRAVSAIEQIDRQLARRPQLERDLQSASSTIETCEESIASLRKQREELGFDPEALQRSNDALKAARQEDRESRERLNAAERTMREAEYRLETLRKEQQQLKDLAMDAEEHRRVREELDMMYNEFSAFDRFVAQHQSPMLSDLTSDIVAEMTDGKYDRVVFDEDYGIDVFDQSDEGFPLETFSGGERDAISLAARLALSRMIGQQAANPPGFLVLDEVFGSLDTLRRERVLTLLGQHSTDYFRQMFIISHIDDVQQSPVFDTVWQVEERPDGSSQITTSDSVLGDILTE